MNNYNWIIDDLLKSFSLCLVYRNNKVIGQFDPFKMVDCTGLDININNDNVNDLIELINSSYIRFKINKFDMDIDDVVYLDIPLRNMFMLRDNSNVLLIDREKYELDNIVIPISQLEAFSIMDGFLLDDNYGIIGIKYNEFSDELDRIINICKEYKVNNMNNRYYLLHEVNNINLKRNNKNIKI